MDVLEGEFATPSIKRGCVQYASTNKMEHLALLPLLGVAFVYYVYISTHHPYFYTYCLLTL